MPEAIERCAKCGGTLDGGACHTCEEVNDFLTAQKSLIESFLEQVLGVPVEAGAEPTVVLLALLLRVARSRKVRGLRLELGFPAGEIKLLKDGGDSELLLSLPVLISAALYEALRNLKKDSERGDLFFIDEQSGPFDIRLFSEGDLKIAEVTLEED